jgi:outer membrane protein assembly factor BamB
MNHRHGGWTTHDPTGHRGARHSGGVRSRFSGARILLGILTLVLLGLTPVIGATATATAATATASVSAQTNTGDYTAYLGGPSHDSYNAGATSITPTNIGELQPVWRWDVPASPNTGKTTLWASPTVADGVIYIGAEDGYFYAINETTQQVVWSEFLGLQKGIECGTAGIISTATVANDPNTGLQTVYIYSPDGYLYALNAANGAVVWQTQIYTPNDTKNTLYAWSSPTVANDMVYIGVSSQCGHPEAQAGVAGVNQTTGTLQGMWHTRAGGKIGGSVWSSVAVEPSGSVLVTTGNGNYCSCSEPLYSESMVQLNGQTLTRQSYWQLPQDEAIVDSDFGGSPTLFTADINGVETPMVGACNKNGYYYALAQNDLRAGPVWSWQMTNPYKFLNGECDSAAIFDGTNLIEGGGAGTTINGVTYAGSVQSLNPATGQPIWQTGLPGGVIGSPTEDGAGVVSAQVFMSSTNQTGVYLLDASTGAIIDSIVLPSTSLFGQAVFANNDLLIGGQSNIGLTAYQIANLGPAITVTPDTEPTGAFGTIVTIKGSGFSGTPSVFFSGTGVNVTQVTVASPTVLKVKINVIKLAVTGSYNASVIEPGASGSPYTADTCTACLTVTSSS